MKTLNSNTLTTLSSSNTTTSTQYPNIEDCEIVGKGVYVSKECMEIISKWDSKMSKVWYMSSLSEFKYREGSERDGKIYFQKIADVIDCRYQMIRNYLKENKCPQHLRYLNIIIK